MHNAAPSRTVITLAWIAGLAAGVVLLFTLGAQMECAADVECGRAAHRWWHTPLIVGVAIGPGVGAVLLRQRARRAACPS